MARQGQQLEGHAKDEQTKGGSVVRERGIVRWFNEQRGYGFLTRDNGGADVFVHYSAIQGKGFKTLEEGQEVEFEVAQGPKGLQAQEVVKL
jgi:cold shock protein